MSLLKPTEVQAMDELRPREDPVFDYLLGQATCGRVQVFYGAVPLALIKPFDEKYRPQDHPVGQAAINQVMSEWRSGRVHFAWVYPSGSQYILSDDYITYEAAQLGQPDYVPCWILGEPDPSVVMDIQGPIDPKEIPRQSDDALEE